MKRIEAHQHFWKFNPVRDGWINDEGKAIQQDFFQKELASVLNQNSFDGSVAVQASQSEEETTFLISLAEQHNFIKGVVCSVDLLDGIGERLAFYKKFPAAKGFCHVLQWETQRDLMLHPNFKRGIAELQTHNFTYDLLIFPDQLRFATELVASFREQKFVIDHMAKPFMKRKEITVWKSDIKRIASYQNIYCKISGLVTEIDWKFWKREYFMPYVDIVVNAFGADRFKFGSDLARLPGGASLEEGLCIANDYFRSLSEPEQEKFYELNAVRFYNL